MITVKHPIPKEGVLLEIPLGIIITSVQIRPVDPEHVKALKASIATRGLEHPIIVHARHPDPAAGEQEIKLVEVVLGPGRHRLEAVKALGKKSIMAIIKPAATVQEIQAEQIAENLERKDLTPLQEAELCADVLEQTQGNEDAAAALMGRSVKWVQQRAALTRLGPKVREFVSSGLLPLGHAQLIAQVADQAAQLEIAERVRAHKQSGGYGENRRGEASPPSAIWETRRLVDAAGRPLSNVSWRLEAVFGKHGACSACPHNSANRGDLFADGSKPRASTCLMAPCYNEKANLAGRGARKAANYIVKEKLGRSPADAKKAAEARGVPYVASTAVLEAVKRAKASKSAGTKEAGDGMSGGQTYRESPADKLRGALYRWQESVRGKLSNAIRKSQSVAVLIALLSEASLSKPNVKAEAILLLKKAGSLTDADLLRAARLVRTNNASIPYSWEQDELLKPLAEALKVELPPQPKLEDFKLKKEEKPKEKAAPAKKAKAKRKGKKS